MHPAMMPVGAVSAAAAAGGGTSAPRAVPSSSARSPGNASGRQAHQRTRSTGDLLRLATSNSAAELVGTPTPTAEPTRHGRHGAGLASAPRASPERSASAHALATSLPTDGSCSLGGTCSDDEGDGGSSRRSRRGGHGPAVSRFGCCLPQPADAAPHQYLPCLLHYLGCSSSFQDRQLFVPIALGLLSACHGSLLSCAQQGVLLDRLEALAHDPVAGVRYAVATALAEVRAQAAALTGGPAKPQQQQQEEVQQEMQQQQATEVQQQQLADAGSAGVTAALELPQSSSEQQQPQQDDGQSAPGVPKGAHPLLGYHAYVQQLSRQSSGTISSGGGGANGTSSSSSAAIAIGQQHKMAAADGTAVSRLLSSSSAPAPSTLLHSSSNGHVQRSSSTTSSRPPLPASAAHALRSRHSEPSSASLAAAAAGAVAEGGGADAAAGQGPADWLLNLSNCQQLERLMHVVAVTAGPAC
jgi:hypothetical protein